jgi:hypothetical protein
LGLGVLCGAVVVGVSAFVGAYADEHGQAQTKWEPLLTSRRVSTLALLMLLLFLFALWQVLVDQTLWRIP